MDQKSSANSQVAQTEEELFQKHVQKRPLIFIGTVLFLGKPPANWSGYLPAYQTVRYKVEQVLKGQLNVPEISVEQIVVWGSRTAQPRDTPGLSATLFSVGARLIAFAQKSQDGVWKELDEDLGAIPFSEDTVRKIETIIGKK